MGNPKKCSGRRYFWIQFSGQVAVAAMVLGIFWVGDGLDAAALGFVGGLSLGIILELLLFKPEIEDGFDAANSNPTDLSKGE